MSIVRALVAQFQQPVDKNDPGGMTNREAVSARIIQIALHGRDDDALHVSKVLLSYTDGAPQQYLDLEIKPVAIREADKHGLDPQALVARAGSMLRQAEDQALRDDALSEDD